MDWTAARRELAAIRAARLRPTIDPKTVRDAEVIADDILRWRAQRRNASALAAGLAWRAIEYADAITRQRSPRDAARIVAAYIEHAAAQDTPVRLWRLNWTARGRAARRYAALDAGAPRHLPLARLTAQAAELADRLERIAAA